MKTTRNSLLVSGLSLVLSVAILMGATFAWFTDSVTNTGNVITSGSLEIDAYAYALDMTNTSGTAYRIDGINGGNEFYFENEGQDLKTDPTPIIGETNWEPGQSNAKLLKVENNGSLAANIRLGFDVADGGLEDALWFDFIQVDANGSVTGAFTRRPMSGLNELAQSVTVPVQPEASVSFLLVYGMEEEAGNEYMGKSFSAGVTVMATQATSETDGFGSSQYDAGATGIPDQDWNAGGTASVSMPAGGWADVTTTAVTLGSFSIPRGAIAESAAEVETSIVQRDTPDSNVIVSGNQAAITYEVTVTNLKENNTTPVTVKLNAPKGLDNVALYHNSAAITDFTYDEATGVLTFSATSFSPFTVVFDSVAVTNLTQLVNALQSGGSITLGADITADRTLTVPQGKTVILNLNGYDIKGTNAGVLIENHGTMTINGTSDSCVYTTEISAQGRHALMNYGTMTVNGGVYGDSDTNPANANAIQRGNAVRNLGTMTIKDGTFTCCDNFTNGGYAYAIANGSSAYPDATMTIETATVYGRINGILAADGGKLTVEDGTYTLGSGTETNLWRIVYTSGNGVVEINGGTYTRNVNNDYAFFGAYGETDTDGIIINGGTFTDLVHEYIKVDGSSYTVIKGGTFDGPFNGTLYKDERSGT